MFADDVLQCPCGGRRSIIAVVTDPAVTRNLLVALDLPHEPSAFAPARDPPQAALGWASALAGAPANRMHPAICARAAKSRLFVLDALLLVQLRLERADH